jgi:hypothetical protein
MRAQSARDLQGISRVAGSACLRVSTATCNLFHCGRSPSTTKLLDGSKPDTSIWFETHSYGLGSLARMPGCPHGGVAEATDHRSAPIRQSCPFTASGPAVSARPAPHRRKSICCLLQRSLYDPSGEDLIPWAQAETLAARVPSAHEFTVSCVSANCLRLGALSRLLCFPPHFLRPDSQGVTAVAGGVTAENLQVASATNPTGIDRQTPSLSWELRATLPEAHDLGQSSYRILVASSAEELAEDRGSLWDSGRVQSSQRLYVTYCGRPLTSHQSYYWKVRVWDQVGKASGWSAPAKWTTAIRHPDEWS